MLEKKEIESLVSYLKSAIEKELNRKNYEMVLELISNTALILYNTNIYYTDDELEEYIRKTSDYMMLEKFNARDTTDTVLFFDGFGLNDRGLAQIYLKSLCSEKHVVYVTFEDCVDRIPDIVNIVDSSKSKIASIDRKNGNYISQIEQLNHIVLEEKPKYFFFYSEPDDVVATVIMNAYRGVFKRYQINLTDHAFWLGARCIDYCIEFRDYGAAVSKYYRGIEQNKIVKLPFYPILHEERKFQGYPFKVKDKQKVIFSGGALYKTLGGDNKYYKIVDHLLMNYNDMIFWYAGSGDDRELKKILNKYPGRAYHTSERSDLYQVLKHSVFYLSTYPMCGGLMYQYAAKAGKVPLTLRYDEMTDGFLFNQDSSNIEFDSLECLYSEAHKLLTDEKYRENRATEMQDSVISENAFHDCLVRILEEGISSYNISFRLNDTSAFRYEYLKRQTSTDLDDLIACKKNMRASIKYTPVRFAVGVYRILIKEEVYRLFKLVHK